MFNKQIWDENLATSKFLVKYLLLTISFLSSRKQYDYGTHRKKRFVDKEVYQKSSYGSDVPRETYPPPILSQKDHDINANQLSQLIFQNVINQTIYQITVVLK